MSKNELITLIILQNLSLDFNPPSHHELASLLINFVLPLKRRDKYKIKDRLKPEYMVQLALLRSFDLITAQKARSTIETLWQEQSSRDLLEVLDLTQAKFDIESVVKEIVENEPDAVRDYRNGKKAAFGHLMGITMKKLKGCDEPKEVKRMLEKYLNDT